MNQPTLDEALQARDVAVARVSANADDAWKQAATGAVLQLVEERRPFTTDDVWAALDAVDVETHEPRALGAVMKGLAPADVIRPTGRWVRSRRGVNHARELKEWTAA